MPKAYESLLEKARRLGVKDPHLLNLGDLKQAVRLYGQIEELRIHAKSIGIELPDSGNKGTLERVFRAGVRQRLQDIVKGSTVVYQGEQHLVERIVPVHRHTRISQMYMLRSKASGKLISVPDNTLVGYINRGTD